MPDHESLNALKIYELEKRLNVMLSYSDKAVDKAAEELGVRLEHSNGMISLLKEQASMFITRKEVWLVMAAVGSVATALNVLMVHFAK